MPTRILSLGLLGILSSTAIAGENGITFINPEHLAAADLPFSDAVRVGNTLYLSGKIGYDPASNSLVPGGIEGETRRIMDDLKASLKANGYALKDVVKCTAMLADMQEWPTFNGIYRQYFNPPYPARSAFGANGLALGARVELECIAAKASG